jgi:hypothetical protein
MLYGTASRSAEVPARDVEDLDLRNRQATVRRKGGAIDAIIWQTGTAQLLPRRQAVHCHGARPVPLVARLMCVVTVSRSHERTR